MTFPARETERTISLATIDDREDEREETVEIALTAPDPAVATLGTPSSATGRIEDDEGSSVVTVTAEADAVTEGEDVVFTLTRAQGDVSRALVVSVQVTDADGALASTAPAGVRIEAGDATAELRLGTRDDTVSEATAEVVLALRPGRGVCAGDAVGGHGVGTGRRSSGGDGGGGYGCGGGRRRRGLHPDAGGGPVGCAVGVDPGDGCRLAADGDAAGRREFRGPGAAEATLRLGTEEDAPGESRSRQAGDPDPGRRRGVRPGHAVAGHGDGAGRRTRRRRCRSPTRRR